MKDKKKTLFLKGINAFRKKEYDIAYNYFEKHLRSFPEHTQSYFYIGRIYFCKQDYIKSHDFFTIAYTYDNKNDYYKYYYARSLMHLSDFRTAIEVFISMKEIETDKKEIINFFLGICYYKTDDYSNAYGSLKYVGKKMKRDPRYLKVLSLVSYNIGNFYYNSADYENAILFLNESLKTGFAPASVFFQIGSVFYQKKEYNKAIYYFEKVYKIDNKYQSIEIILSYLYQKNGDYKKLEQHLRKVSISPPKMVEEDFKRIMGFTLYKNGKFNEAIPVFLQLYRANKYDEKILYSLAQSRLATNDIERCERGYNLIFDLTQRDININNSYILFLISQGQFKKAVLKSELWIDKGIYDEKTTLYHFYAMTFDENRVKNAKTIIDTLKKNYNENTMFIEACAEYYKTINVNKSIHYYYKLYTMQPDDNWTIQKIVDIFIRRNLIHQAIYYLEKMYNNTKKNEKLIYYYAYFLIKKRQYHRAVTILREHIKHSHLAAYLCGEIFLRKNKYKKGYQLINKSFHLNPIFLPSQYKILRYFFKNDQSKNAIKICRMMKKTSPSFYRIELYLALIYFKNKRPDISIKHLNNYIKSGKKNKFIMLALIWCYYIEGKNDTALELTRKTIQLYGLSSQTVILQLLIARKKYEIEKEKKLEKKLFSVYKQSPSTKAYYEKYKQVASTSFKRRDIGFPVF